MVLPSSAGSAAAGQTTQQQATSSSQTTNHTMPTPIAVDPRYSQFIQSITERPSSSAHVSPAPPSTSPTSEFRRRQPTAWSSPAPAANAPTFGDPSPTRSLADYTPDVGALLSGSRTSSTALTSPWLWQRRPVDTRHLPVPRPLPPVYSDVRRMRAPPLDLREPWQRWLQVLTLVSCGTLAAYTALYLPIEQDDMMHSVRRWWFGNTYQPAQQRKVSPEINLR